jgi:WD40 repeat protein
MTPKHIHWKALTPFTLAVVTLAVSSCTALTPRTQELITQSPQNRQLLRTLSSRSDSGYSVAYSPGISKANSAVGEILASASQDGTIKIWRVLPQ